MLEFLRKNKPTQVNNDVSVSADTQLRRIRKRIGLQIALTALTLLLTAVIAFGMTAAWYTNVVRTGGLVFEVEKIGVNVNAKVSTDKITAKPGDNGVIGLEATNNGTQAVRVSVAVSKNAMAEEMRRRLYFYVDAQSTQNGELVQRTYLTRTDSYTYTLFPQNALKLTSTYHNDASLKWCWVYDVLGYYVLGKAEGTEVTVDEYLRPIEYDYDRATFDAEGNLRTVDGKTSATDFLVELSKTDGYAGVIDPNQKTGDYYEVSVDENGYGVYAYLCTYAQIENNTAYDTALGEAALDNKVETYTALLTVTAENATYETVSVKTEAEIRNYLSSGNVIRLENDVTLTSQLKLEKGKNVQLDLNGHTLTTSTGDTFAIALEEEAALTLTNGTLTGNGSEHAFSLAGSDLTLNNITLNHYARGVNVEDTNANGQTSVVHMTDCVMSTTDFTVRFFGNGTASEQRSRLYIERCKLTSDKYVVVGNGTEKWGGTDIQILDSKLTQNAEKNAYAAVFNPQKDSTLYIYNSTVSGYNGVVIKAGDVTIENSHIYGVGTNPAAPKLSGDGYADTADAIYIETAYPNDILLTLSDSEARSSYSCGLRVFEENSPYVTIVRLGENMITDEADKNAG